MSDRYSVELDKVFSCDPTDYTAVISGIGQDGDNASLFIASNLNEMVREELLKGRNFLKAVEEACVELDCRLLKSSGNGCIFNESGATYCSFWIQEGRLFCANVGNCRVIASHAGIAMAITKDHVPDDPIERCRIEHSGGRVYCNKIDYKYGASRAFGLFSYKSKVFPKSLQQVIIALPSVYEVKMDPNVDFIVLASNSVWEILTNQQVVTFIENHLRDRMSLEQTACGLIDWCESLWRCQRVHHGTGNLTCVIVTLYPNVFCGAPLLPSHQAHHIHHGHTASRCSSMPCPP